MTTRKPIVPSMIIPGGVPLPPGPPAPDAVPPWRIPAAAAAAPPPPPPTAPPAVAVPAPQPPPAPVPHIHVHLVAPYYEEPEPTRRQRLWAWITSIGRPWQIAAALALAFAPIPGVGYSIATTWASLVTEARAEYGQANAYALALTPLALAVMRIVTGGGTLRRLLLLAISLTGLMGAIDLYDPVTWITGVHPS
ncbi:hypothetical protein YUYDRAFT_02100 [Streptomyces sp. ScaeMP-e48]|uniref:hypothetical protein n=1 Tax=Streptomyces sp. ScaeMP-e48 TaxID=1100823 RepID=UPI000823F1FC|nr:hypothetical protein [Streptomyces sp. ScaeMP-e48]SCK20208.1 hypothetical protein YUYDRAFT_02100 [Streptomyces sp. ScaeMP-e48]